jgi:arsenate reductase
MITPELNSYIKNLKEEFDHIPQDRKKLLREISGFIRARTDDRKPAKVTFICTHNSRRSIIGQIWAQTAAHYYGIHNFQSFSGGTEASAFHPSAVKTMKNAGFRIEVLEKSKNPVYSILFSEEAPPLRIYSKNYNENSNPGNDFLAVMTCSEADENCPYIPGAIQRISLHYEDPKVSDGTSHEIAAYAERTRQIGREIFFLFSEIKK